MVNKISKSAILLPLFAIQLYAGGSFTETELDIEIPRMLAEVESEDGRFYVNANLGVSIVTVEADLEKGSTFSSGALDNSGMTFQVGAGYRMANHFSFDVNYQYLGLDLASLSNFYASINYEFADYEYNPYIGLLYGQSSLNWSKAPHMVLIDKDLRSTSPLYGLQVGLRNEFSDNIYYGLKYQYMILDHEMDIRNGRSTISHTQSNNFSLGVQYEF